MTKPRTPEDRQRALGITQKAADRFAEHAKRLGVSAQSAAAENELLMYGEIADDMYKAWYFEDEGAVFPSSVRARLAEIEGDVVIRMNSPGGDVFAGAAIGALIDDVREEGRKVTVRVDGLAASAASYIAIRADEVVMDEVAQIMVHRPWTSLYGGDEEDFAKVAEQLRTTKKGMIATYTRRNRKGLDAEAITALVDEETWMDGEEAVKQGFADRVKEPPADRKKKKKDSAKASDEEPDATVMACAKVHAEIQRGILSRLTK